MPDDSTTGATLAALRESEGRHRFLAELSAATQPLTDASAVMATTARMLAEHLDVDRCAYAEVEDESVFVITGDYPRRVPSIVGRWPVAAFGAECERCMRENRPYVVDDVDADLRAGRDLEAYRATNIQAVICVPLRKAGRFSAAMAVHQMTPRRWSREEIALVLTVVDRCWETLERTRVARGLKDTADRLALALDAARLGDWSWEASTDVVTLSPRAAELFGIPPGPQLTWTKMQQLLHPDDRDYARLAVLEAVEKRTQYDVEYRVQRSNGEVWLSAMGRAAYDLKGQPTGMFGVVQDITEKKRLEHELRERAARLATADREKDDFIALLGHELRNPLAPLRTGVQLLNRSGQSGPPSPRVLDMMDRQLSHVVRLIDDLLDVSRLTRHKLELKRAPMVLSEAVDAAVEATAGAIEQSGHHLAVRLPEVPVHLDADLTRLAQVFGNLLSNAAKYTDRGGHIVVSAEVKGEQVTVQVSDDGIGIEREAMPLVFQMFSQLGRSKDRAAGGLGIGLALVKGLVESHGGTVSAASPGPGRGSTFTVTLPVDVKAQAAEPAPLAAPAPAAKGTGRTRVLIADDNLDAAASLADLIEALGGEAAVVHDGAAAVKAVERMRPDLVLMDIGMPVLDGLGATEQIRAQPWGRELTIIALTGWGQETDRARTRQAGCDGHLVKPVDIEQLERLLGRAPGGERTVPFVHH